ncbi:MAG: hypothetical protein HJJLKODD_01195 [Phycisphaerae bacterium]|nr:hypothetical protein [Phycisphaerae bacterium]
MTPAPTLPSSRRAFAILITLTAGLAIWLRTCELGRENFWLDEICSMISSAGHFDELSALPRNSIIPAPPNLARLTETSTPAAIWSGQKADIHPPLYFLLLRGWRALWGDSELAVRIFSICCSLLAMILLALVVRESAGGRAALLTLLISAVAYGDLEIAREARQYALAMTLICGSFLALLRLERLEAAKQLSSRPGWLWLGAYSALLLAAMLTHYFSILVLLGHPLYAGVRFRGGLLKRWAFAVVIGGGIYGLLWGDALVHQLRHNAEATGWLLEQDPHHVGNCFIRLGNLPVRLLWQQSFGSNLSLTQLAGGVALLLSLACLLFWKKPSGTLLFWIWYVLPATALLLLDIFTQRGTLGHSRYVVFALPGLIGLISLALQRWPTWCQTLAMTLLLMGTYIQLHYPLRNFPDSRSAAEKIDSALQPDTLLIFDGSGSFDWLAMEMFLNCWYYLPHPPAAVLISPLPPSDEVQKQFVQYQQLIILNQELRPPEYPALQQFEWLGQTEVLRQLGPIYLFIKK